MLSVKLLIDFFFFFTLTSDQYIDTRQNQWGPDLQLRTSAVQTLEPTQNQFRTSQQSHFKQWLSAGISCQNREVGAGCSSSVFLWQEEPCRVSSLKVSPRGGFISIITFFSHPLQQPVCSCCCVLPLQCFDQCGWREKWKWTCEMKWIPRLVKRFFSIKFYWSRKSLNQWTLVS